MICLLSNSLLPCHTFILVVGLPGITTFFVCALPLCWTLVCQAVFHFVALLFVYVSDMFAKHYFILLNCSAFILIDLSSSVSCCHPPPSLYWWWFYQEIHHTWGMLCLYGNIYSPVLYLVTLINKQSLFCYVVPLNMYIGNGFAKHFTLCQHLFVNQWICQALLYCYCPALPVLHIRDGFAEHYFIFRCIRKTAKIDFASSYLSICVEQFGSH